LLGLVLIIWVTFEVSTGGNFTNFENV
jgi:hypothetical protein